MRKNDVKNIIPSRDEDCLFFSSIRTELLNNGIYVMVSGKKTINLVNDKFYFYSMMNKHQIATIETYKDLEKLKNDNKYIIKSRFGSGSKNIFILKSLIDANEIFENNSDLIIQPFITGFEISVDFYVTKENKVKGIITRKRDLVIDGESHITSLYSDERIPPIIEKLVEIFDFYGHINAQFIVDEKNSLKILEVNPRIGGASTFSIKIGLNSIKWFIYEAQGKNINNLPFIVDRNITKMIRIKKDLFF